MKFKRLAETRGEFERWHESFAEIFLFPLTERAWALLLAEMKKNVRPPRGAHRNEALRFLRSIDPRIHTVVVQKELRSHWWGSHAEVKIEMAEILSPVPTISIRTRG